MEAYCFGFSAFQSRLSFYCFSFGTRAEQRDIAAMEAIEKREPRVSRNSKMAERIREL